MRNPTIEILFRCHRCDEVTVMRDGGQLMPVPSTDPGVGMRGIRYDFTGLLDGWRVEEDRIRLTCPKCLTKGGSLR